MGRNKNLPLYEKVKITDIGAEGKAIARHDGMVLFTTHVIPGDIVDLQVTKRGTKYFEAKVVKIHENSPDRIPAFCNTSRSLRRMQMAIPPLRKAIVL